MTARIPLVINSGAIQELQSGDSFNLGTGASLTSPTIATSMTLSYGTANQVQYLNGSKQLVGDADLTFDGTTLSVAAINVTTVDLTNLEVTNIKAKDGTAAITLADSTGVATFSANPLLNAGTANGVAYLNGSKVLTSGTSLIFDGTNLGVGITPTAPLHIKGDSVAFKIQAATVNSSVFQGFYNSVGTRRGYAGYGTNSNSDLSFANEENGNLILQTNNKNLILGSSGVLGLGVLPLTLPASQNQFFAIGDPDTGLGWVSDGRLTLCSNNLESVRVYQQAVSIGNDTATAIPAGIRLNVSGGAIRAYNDAYPQIQATSTGGITNFLASDASNGLIGTTSNHDLMIRTNNTDKVRVNTAGSVRIGETASISSQVTLGVNRSLTGALTSIGVLSAGVISSDATSSGQYFRTTAATAATAFSTNIYHYTAAQGTIGAGSSVSTQFGFIAENSLTGATSNYGFYGDIPSGANRWNFYANGTAANHMNGALLIGTTSQFATGLTIRKDSSQYQILSISNQQAAQGAMFNIQTASTAGIGWDIGLLGSTTAMSFRYDTTEVFKMLSNGHIYANNGISVRGGTAYGTNGYSFDAYGDTDGGMYSPSDGIITFAVNATEAMRINGAGAGAPYFGLGTSTNTTYRLYVNGTSFFNGDLRLSNGADLIIGSADGGALSTIYNDASNIIFTANGGVRGVFNSGGLTAYDGFTLASGTLSMTNGVIRATAGSTYGSNGYSFNSAGDTDGGMYSPADGTLVWATNNAEKMRLTAAGNLGLGTTIASIAGQNRVFAIGDSDTGMGWISDGILTLCANATETVRVVASNVGICHPGNVGSRLIIGNGSGTTMGAYFAANGSGDQLIIYANGASGGSYFYYNAANAYGTISDRRIKEDISDIEEAEAVEFVKSLTPKKFTLTDIQTRQAGWIAQDVLASAKTEEQRNIINNHETYDEFDPECPHLGVSDIRMLPYVVKSLQKALREIDELKSEIAVLRGNK